MGNCPRWSGGQPTTGTVQFGHQEEEEGGLIMAAAVDTSIKEGTGVRSAILGRPQTKVRTGDMISL